MAALPTDLSAASSCSPEPVQRSSDFANISDLISWGLPKTSSVRELPLSPALRSALAAERKRAEDAEKAAADLAIKYESARKALTAAMAGWSDSSGLHGHTQQLHAELQASQSRAAQQQQQLDDCQQQHSETKQQLACVRHELDLAKLRITSLLQHNENITRLAATMRAEAEATALAVLRPAVLILIDAAQESQQEAGRLVTAVQELGQSEEARYDDIFDALQEARAAETRVRQQNKQLQDEAVAARAAVREADSEAVAAGRRISSLQAEVRQAETNAAWLRRNKEELALRLKGAENKASHAAAVIVHLEEENRRLQEEQQKQLGMVAEMEDEVRAVQDAQNGLVQRLGERLHNVSFSVQSHKVATTLREIQERRMEEAALAARHRDGSLKLSLASLVRLFTAPPPHCQALPPPSPALMVGVGMTLSDSKRVAILAEAGPAAVCGLIAVGDELLAVDGKDVSALSWQDCCQLLVGAVGSEVTLLFARQPPQGSGDADAGHWGAGNMMRVRESVERLRELMQSESLVGADGEDQENAQSIGHVPPAAPVKYQVVLQRGSEAERRSREDELRRYQESADRVKQENDEAQSAYAQRVRQDIGRLASRVSGLGWHLHDHSMQSSTSPRQTRAVSPSEAHATGAMFEEAGECRQLTANERVGQEILEARERLEILRCWQRIVSRPLVLAFESWLEYTESHREVSLISFSARGSSCSRLSAQVQKAPEAPASSAPPAKRASWPIDSRGTGALPPAGGLAFTPRSVAGGLMSMQAQGLLGICVPKLWREGSTPRPQSPRLIASPAKHLPFYSEWEIREEARQSVREYLSKRDANIRAIVGQEIARRETERDGQSVVSEIAASTSCVSSSEAGSEARAGSVVHVGAHAHDSDRCSTMQNRIYEWEDQGGVWVRVRPLSAVISAGDVRGVGEPEDATSNASAQEAAEGARTGSVTSAWAGDHSPLYQATSVPSAAVPRLSLNMVTAPPGEKASRGRRVSKSNFTSGTLV